MFENMDYTVPVSENDALFQSFWRLRRVGCREPAFAYCSRLQALRHSGQTPENSRVKPVIS